VKSTEIYGNMRVIMKPVASANPRSEQYHTDTTAANADRETVVAIWITIVWTRHANGGSRV
jgi:ectoine hydroxylase-related dioxygenase (phytanoyl-CoA dioxygenase family)